MTAERNLTLTSFFSFAASALFFVPVMLPYFKDHIGLGYQGLLLGESSFAASCILFDVPTSWISDIWRRKHSLALGVTVNFLGLWAFVVAHNIWHIMIAEIIVGIGISLINGTNTALLYDSLLSLGRGNEYRRREGKRQACSLYGIAFAGIIGGLVYSENNYLPFYLSMLAQVVGFVIVCAMYEPERHQQADRRHPVADIVETIKYILHGHAELGIIVLSAAILFCSTKIIMWSQQPYFMALDLPKPMYGILMAGGWVLGGLSSHWAHLLDGKVKIFRALAFSWSVAIAACLGAGVFVGPLGIVLLMIGGSCIFGMTSPRISEAINLNVGSERRATALSTQSVLAQSLFIPVSFVIGWASDRWTIQTGLSMLAAWLVIAGFCLLVLKRIRVKVPLS